VADRRAAVLVMAYGTPQRHEDIEAYYTHIRRGTPPEPAALRDLQDRYRALGGVSPLRRITEGQATGIQEALDERSPGEYRVHLGLKHAAPFIEDGAQAIVGAAHQRAVGLVLAPHHSRMGVGAYHRRAAAAIGDALPYVGVGSWHLHPGYVDLVARSVAEALDRIRGDRRERTHVLFTAHSLPASIVEEGDRYPVQLRESAQATTARLEELGVDLPLRPSIAWQSAGRTADRWLGPDLLDVIPKLAEAHDLRAVVVAPVGFVSDHLEVLYDVDIQARGVAEQHGLVLERTEMPNTQPRFLDLLADVITDADGAAA